MSRPSETLTATIATIVGAFLAILAGYGVHVPDGVQAGAVILIGYIAAAVTFFVARRQRDGKITSARDGTVQG